MAATFISEPIVPVEASFDTGGMARGEPGLPHKFRWRKKEFVVAEVLERWKEHGNCRHGSGERYVRRFSYRIRTTDDIFFNLYFLRSTDGGGKISNKSRWRVQSVEGCAEGLPQTK